METRVESIENIDVSPQESSPNPVDLLCKLAAKDTTNSMDLINFFEQYPDTNVNGFHSTQWLSPIQITARSGSLSTFSYLLRVKKASLSAVDIPNMLAHASCKTSSIQIREYIIEHKLWRKFNDGTTFSNILIWGGTYQQAKSAIDKELDEDIVDPDYNSLQHFVDIRVADDGIAAYYKEKLAERDDYDELQECFDEMEEEIKDGFELTENEAVILNGNYEDAKRALSQEVAKTENYSRVNHLLNIRLDMSPRDQLIFYYNELLIMKITKKNNADCLYDFSDSDEETRSNKRSWDEIKTLTASEDKKRPRLSRKQQHNQLKKKLKETVVPHSTNPEQENINEFCKLIRHPTATFTTLTDFLIKTPTFDINLRDDTTFLTPLQTAARIGDIKFFYFLYDDEGASLRVDKENEALNMMEHASIAGANTRAHNKLRQCIMDDKLWEEFGDGTTEQHVNIWNGSFDQALEALNTLQEDPDHDAGLLNHLVVLRHRNRPDDEFYDYLSVTQNPAINDQINPQYLIDDFCNLASKKFTTAKDIKDYFDVHPKIDVNGRHSGSHLRAIDIVALSGSYSTFCYLIENRNIVLTSDKDAQTEETICNLFGYASGIKSSAAIRQYIFDNQLWRFFNDNIPAEYASIWNGSFKEAKKALSSVSKNTATDFRYVYKLIQLRALNLPDDPLSAEFLKIVPVCDEKDSLEDRIKKSAEAYLQIDPQLLNVYISRGDFSKFIWLLSTDLSRITETYPIISILSEDNKLNCADILKLFFLKMCLRDYYLEISNREQWPELRDYYKFQASNLLPEDDAEQPIKFIALALECSRFAILADPSEKNFVEEDILFFILANSYGMAANIVNQNIANQNLTSQSYQKLLSLHKQVIENFSSALKYLVFLRKKDETFTKVYAKYRDQLALQFCALGNVYSIIGAWLTGDEKVECVFYFKKSLEEALNVATNLPRHGYELDFCYDTGLIPPVNPSLQISIINDLKNLQLFIDNTPKFDDSDKKFAIYNVLDFKIKIESNTTTERKNKRKAERHLFKDEPVESLGKKEKKTPGAVSAFHFFSPSSSSSSSSSSVSHTDTASETLGTSCQRQPGG